MEMIYLGPLVMSHAAPPIDRRPPPFYETRQMDSETTTACYQDDLSRERLDNLFLDLSHTQFRWCINALEINSDQRMTFVSPPISYSTTMADCLTRKPRRRLDSCPLASSDDRVSRCVIHLSSTRPVVSTA